MIGNKNDIGAVSPNVAKAGGLQSPRKRDFRDAPTSAEGEAVIIYCEPLATRVEDPVEDGNLKSSGFLETGKQCSKMGPIPGIHQM